MDLVRNFLVMHLLPLCVFLKVGFSLQLWIEIFLTRLGLDPAGVHAF